MNVGQCTAGTSAENTHVDASGEYVSETGRVLGSRGMPGPAALDEQAQTDGAADIWVFPATAPASGFPVAAPAPIHSSSAAFFLWIISSILSV